MFEIKPLCPVFGECGGCQYQDVSYPEELRVKELGLRTMFRERLNVSDELFDPIVASPQEYHYRNRIDLRLVKTKTGDVFIGFSPQRYDRVIPIEACPIALPVISRAIPSLKRQIQEKLPERYRNANVVVRTGEGGQVRWGGIGRKSLSLEEADYFWTEIQGKKIFYSLDTFFQANLFILPLIVERLAALPIFDAQRRDSTILLDLYGGVGLFGICLSSKVQRVILIEEDVHSLKLARYNIAYNQLTQFDILKGRVENELPAFLETLASAPKVALIDPPRGGLSPAAAKILSSAKSLNHLLYLSCSPETLVRDLELFLQAGWEIIKVLPFDFFPRTKHLETLVLLKGCTYAKQ